MKFHSVLLVTVTLGVSYVHSFEEINNDKKGNGTIKQFEHIAMTISYLGDARQLHHDKLNYFDSHNDDFDSIGNNFIDSSYLEDDHYGLESFPL